MENKQNSHPIQMNSTTEKESFERDRDFSLDGSYDYYSKSRSRKYRAHKYRITSLSK